MRLLVGDLQYRQSTGEWPFAAPELPAQFELPLQLLANQRPAAPPPANDAAYDEGEIHAYLERRNLAAAFVHTTPVDVWQLEAVITGAVVLYKTD